MGRSCACKFMYGNNTAVVEKDKIDAALENKTELKTELIFYRRDGKYTFVFIDGPRHVKTCLRVYADSEGPDQRLTRTFTVHKQNNWLL